VAISKPSINSVKIISDQMGLVFGAKIVARIIDESIRDGTLNITNNITWKIENTNWLVDENGKKTTGRKGNKTGEFITRKTKKV
jgi:hypothetical protein